jgi:large subunit ribosomal protein L6
MSTLKDKKIIKVPNNVSIYYNRNKDVLLIKGVSKKKIVKLKLKLEISRCGKDIKVLNPVQLNTKKVSNYLKALKGTTVALIKKGLLEVSMNFYKKLKIAGVGYKIFIVESGNNKILHLKLGYSHSIFIKVPGNINVDSSKLSTLFIQGSDSIKVAEFASLIRSCKVPDPYKGKGIAFDNEIINLKVGKVI